MRRILIVDDQAYDKKCEPILQVLKEKGLPYDVALNLKETKRLLQREIPYDGIVLDKYFPTDGEDKRTDTAADKVLEILEKQHYQGIVLINSWSTMSIPKSKLVFNQMAPWELHKLQHFLDFIICQEESSLE